MEIIKISILVLIVVVLSASLPVMSKEISLLVMFACCTVVLLYITNQIIPAVEYIKYIAEKIEFEDISIVFKAVGIGFITQFVSDTALDCNNRALSNQMIFAGRVCILITGLPVITGIFEILENLI